MIQIKLKYILGFFCLLLLSMVQAQNESKGKTTTPQRNQGEATKTVPKSGDMGGLKVDNMSDAQVQDAMKKMQESGYTEQQIEQAAKARGMDDAEIQRFKQRRWCDG